MTDETKQPRLHVVRITDAEHTGVRYQGPYRLEVAQAVAEAATSLGAHTEIAELTMDLDAEITAVLSQWPPSGFQPSEVASTYTMPSDRYVVSLVASYSDEDATGPHDAAYQLLEMTRDEGCSDTKLFVFDRQTGHMHAVEQEDVDRRLFDGAQ